MLNEIRQIPQVWSRAWDSPGFRNQFVLTFLLFAGVILHHLHYLRIWQGRPGIRVDDVVLNLLPPVNFSMPIFLLEYSAMFLVFILVLAAPNAFVRGLQMFALILFARTFTVYFFPLEPPKDMILLTDPVANFFLHTTDIFVTKDLFFSGHVSALTLLTMIAYNKHVKAYALIATIVVGVMILWQHVHYSMDVAFAPLVSYASYKLVIYFHRETRYGLEWQDA